MLEKKQIQNLIKNGFDIESISFEFEIPIEYVKICKQELESNKHTNIKIEIIRERYKKLFLEGDEIEIKQQPQVSQQDNELIEKVIMAIETKVQESVGLEQNEKKKIVRVILNELEKIKDCQLTIEQAEELIYLLNSEEPRGIGRGIEGRLNIYFDSVKLKLYRKLAKSIDIIQAQTDNIEELRLLSKKITYVMTQKDQITIGSVKDRINNKILTLTQKQAIDKIRNDIPESIDNIVLDIAQGRLDFESANLIIDKEAKKKTIGRPKTMFALTEEQCRRQILIQIRTIIAEKSSKYHIENPKITIEQLQKLCCIELEQAVRAVVENLIFSKDFERAKQVCNEFDSNDNKKMDYINTIQRLRKDIKNAEIGELVLKLIEMQSTPEEENACFELIEKGLRFGKTKMESISLGKSKNGLRDITLADVWNEEKQNCR